MERRDAERTRAPERGRFMLLPEFAKSFGLDVAPDRLKLVLLPLLALGALFAVPLLLTLLLAGCSPGVESGFQTPGSGDASVPRSDGRVPQSPDLCADVELVATRTTPNVIMIVDQSRSMDDDFGSSDRWNVLRDSLLASPGGFISDLQWEVRFGLALFSGSPELCPALTTVSPALNNFAPISDVYAAADVISETPTGDAIEALLDQLLGAPDPSTDPTIFVLATDGEPDTCAVPNPQRGQSQALEAVERAYGNAIRTYVISVGREISETHLQDMANAGLGRRAGEDDAQFWVAGDDSGLRDALSEIIGGALSCVVELNGSIATESACSGRVELNGLVLPCDDPDGWEALDENHIELRGRACETLQNGTGVLRASFPCDVVLI